jgi:hypothetical protein
MDVGKQEEGLRTRKEESATDSLVELKIKVPADLYRAYQRCSWVLINETGCDQLDIMEEMVYDFLVKNEC